MTMVDPPVVDDFTRSNSGTLGASWTADTFGFGGVQWAIVSNQAAASNGNYCDVYYNAATYGPEIRVAIPVVTLPSNATGEIGLHFSAQSPGSAAGDGYRVGYIKGTGFRIIEVLNGAQTTLTTVSDTIADGDWLGAEVTGSTINFCKRVSSTWSVVATTSDATYTGLTGSVGFWSFANGGGAGVVEEFRAETVTGTPTVGPKLRTVRSALQW